MPNQELTQSAIDTNTEVIDSVLTFTGATTSKTFEVTSSEWEWDNYAAIHPGTGMASCEQTVTGFLKLVFPFMETDETPNSFCADEYEFKFIEAAGMLKISGSYNGRHFKFYTYLEEKQA